jgi:hypothetical protein
MIQPGRRNDRQKWGPFDHRMGDHLWPGSSRILANGVAEAVPDASVQLIVHSMRLSRCCLSNVCRSPRPRPRLPVRVEGLKTTLSQGRAGGARMGVGTLVLALTSVVDWQSRTGGASPWLGQARALPPALPQVLPGYPAAPPDAAVGESETTLQGIRGCALGE